VAVAAYTPIAVDENVGISQPHSELG